MPINEFAIDICGLDESKPTFTVEETIRGQLVHIHRNKLRRRHNGDQGFYHFHDYLPTHREVTHLFCELKRTIKKTKNQ